MSKKQRNVYIDAAVMQQSVEKFDRQIFMGNGAYSQAQAGKAFMLLAEAFDILNRIQQLPHMLDGAENVEWEMEYEQGQKLLRSIAEQLCIALTGIHTILQERK